jgi:hypothetical protein
MVLDRILAGKEVSGRALIELVIPYGYAVLVALALTMTIRAHCTGSTYGFVAYIRAVMRHTWSRWIVLVVWCWAGWHFFVR